MLGVPVYNKPLVSGSPNELPVKIESDQSSANYPDHALFTGDVNVEQGNSTLKAQQVQVNQKFLKDQSDPVRTATATGNVDYADNQIKLKGPSAWVNLSNKDTNVWKGDYQFVGRQGRGNADVMKTREENRYTIMENGTFTPCLPGDNSWSVEGSEIIQDHEEEVAEIWNARFKIGSVPVFYSPYIQLPTGNKRRSGFLLPTASYSTSNGAEFSLPWYWNIAPQADATFTPHYIENRGLQLENEFRYLSALGAGVMELDWLSKDRRYAHDREHKDGVDNAHNRKRWLYYWNHFGVIDHWRLKVDYTKVSDPYYFDDLSSTYGSSTDGYARQKFSAGYADTNWDATVSTTKFQVFSNAGNRQAYRTEPQLDTNYYQNDLGPFDFRVYGQAARFTNEDIMMPQGKRFHVEPTLNLPISNRWASLNAETKMLATHYKQHVSRKSTQYYNTIDDHINRTMPEFKLDGKMIFDRDMNLLQGYTQTLEPRAQYLYIPFREQKRIGNYDSTLLQSDYTGLFRDRSYSGLDRIASANQVTTGLTSRLYDESLVERFNASIGQTYYFDRSRTTDSRKYTSVPRDKDRNNGSLLWAGDSFWKISDNWGLRGGVQYDARLDNVALGDAVMEYRRDSETMLQLSYRYASADYVAAMIPQYRKNDVYDKGINQVGGIGSYPIADRWSVVGAYYHDTNANQTADALLGVQYNNCCWSIGVGYERKIDSWNKDSRNSKYDNKFFIRFALRGLDGDYGLGSAKMLQHGILPYQRAF